MTEAEVASKTFTGTNANKLDFKNVKIENAVKDADGNYTSIDAVFTK